MSFNLIAPPTMPASLPPLPTRFFPSAFKTPSACLIMIQVRHRPRIRAEGQHLMMKNNTHISEHSAEVWKGNPNQQQITLNWSFHPFSLFIQSWYLTCRYVERRKDILRCFLMTSKRISEDILKAWGMGWVCRWIVKIFISCKEKFWIHTTGISHRDFPGTKEFYIHMHHLRVEPFCLRYVGQGDTYAV